MYLLVVPKECVLSPIHPGTEGQTWILSKWWNNQSERQSKKNKASWQHNLHRQKNVLCKQEKQQPCLISQVKLFKIPRGLILRYQIDLKNAAVIIAGAAFLFSISAVTLPGQQSLCRTALHDATF